LNQPARTVTTLLSVLVLLGLLWAGALPVAAAYGLDAGRLAAPPDPNGLQVRRSPAEEFQLPLIPNDPLLLYEADTLGGTLVVTAWGRDGRLVGTRLTLLDQELLTRLDAGNRRSLGKGLAENALKAKTQGKDHIEIDIPFKVKSKTFRRIFGSGRIGLNVHGNINVKGTYRNEKRESESASAFVNNQNDFRLDQEQQFTVVGKIGEKVDVHIDQNTERSFDFENNLSITYTGEPEEIIEKIEAGNISLSLPSTKYVSFNDKSSGLFGLKMVNRFGPLRLTGVASTEKNESKQQTFTGQTSDQNREIGPGQHETGYFFVNEYFRHQYRIFDANWNALTVPAFEITQFSLYEFTTDQQGVELDLVDPNGRSLATGYRMKRTDWNESATNPPFTLDKYRGILKLGSIQPGKYYAMAYQVRNMTTLLDWYRDNVQDSTALRTGKLGADTGDEVVVVFPLHFSPTNQPFWDLQLRNVFNLGTLDMDATKFDMEIGKVVSGTRNQTTQNGLDDYLAVLYLDVLDLQRNAPGNDTKVDERWIDAKTGNIWFPSPRPFANPSDPQAWVLQPSASDSLYQRLLAEGMPAEQAGLYRGYTRAPNRVDQATNQFTRVAAFQDAEMDTLYDLRGSYYGQSPDPKWQELNQRFRLISSAKVGTEVISLGWNVTNVTVTANGKRLAQGTDYTLDEQAGLIRIINPAYTKEDQKIQVSYETPQLFQLRKKTFAGVTAELNLWETGQNEVSKLGAAFIYFNEESSERKVRLGNEPIKNSVLDLNAKLIFQPRIMTQWMDALPLIEAEAPSRLTFESEFAIVLPDPNPSNNPDTGDNNGVAYVDDFESSKQEIPLSLSHTQWGLSSLPRQELLGLRGWMGWYNPQTKVSSREIWPNYSESNREGVSNEVRVLRLEYSPFLLASQAESGSDQTLTGEPLSRDLSWGGVYYDFRNAYDDLTRKKFLELTLKVEGDRSGRLHLDLGVVSEDVIPNGSLDKEDQNSDNVLQNDEDLGLDIRKGADPPWPLPDELFAWSGGAEDQIAQLGAYGVTNLDNIFDWWDLDGDGVRDPAEPWSMDNWLRAESAGQPVDKSHGSEGNSQDSDQYYPDSEDRNGNLSLDTQDNYSGFTIPLDPSHPDYDTYVSSIEGSEWIFVRIPLSDPAQVKVGTPRLDQVNGVRLWMTGFREPVTLTLAELNIVGTEWVKTTSEGDTTGFDVSVLNNFDNSEHYISPPGVAGNKDLITGVEAREQALVVELQDLAYGRTAWVSKTLDLPVNLSEYRELKMFTHGGSGKTAEDSLAFLAAFGTDKLEYHLRLQSTPGNYYEYSKFIHPGWDPLNNMHIILADITAIDPFTGATRDQEEPDKPLLLPDGGQVRVSGNPTITRISTMLLGVTNHGGAPARTEIWFNELRVSNVKKRSSRAMRADVTAKFSDVLNLNTNYERMDADYHTVKERTPASPTYKENFSASADMDMGRLLPPSWGMSARLAVNTAQRLSVPKFYPNDDEEVDLRNRPQSVETWSRAQGATLTLKKSNSRSGWAKQTVDKVTFTTDATTTLSRNTTVAMDTSYTQNVRFGYANNFTWTHTLKPLGFTKDWPLVGKAAALEIGYFPENFNLNASTARRIQHTWKRDLTNTHLETYTLNRSWSTSFKPLKTLTLSAQRNYNNNLRFRRNQARLPELLPVTNPNHEAGLDFISRLGVWREQERDLHDGDHEISQSANASWNPKLVSWTTTNFSYSTTYRWNRDLADPSRGLSLGNTGKFTAELKPDFGKLARSFLLMNEEEYNAAKKEVADAATTRTKERQAKAEERRVKREAKRQAKEAEKAGKQGGDAPAVEPAPAEPDVEGAAPAEEPVEVAKPKARRGQTRRDEPTAPVGEPEAPPVEDMPALPVAETPPPPVVVEPRPLPLLGDSLGLALPDSLLGSLALADSLIRAAVAADSSAGAPGRPAQGLPDSPGRRPETARAVAGQDSLASTALTGADSTEARGWKVWEVLGGAGRRVWRRTGLLTGLLEPIDVRFSRDAGRTDPGMAIYPWTPVGARHAALGYQLGLSQDPGVDTLRVSNAVFTTSRTFGYNYTLGTRVNLHKELPVKLGYEYSYNQQFSNESESGRGEAQTGWYDFENDPLMGKGTKAEGDEVGPNPALRNLPNYSFSLRKLNRLPLLGKWFKDLNLNHDYRGKEETTYSRAAEGVQRTGLRYSRDFSPLAGMDFQLDKGWSGSASYKYTRALAVADPDGATRSVTLRTVRGWTLSGQKTLKNGFKLPGMKTRFKNDTTLRLTYDNSINLDLKSTKGADNLLVWNTPLEKRDWGLTLATDYAFSRNVRGGGSLKYGVNRSSQANDKTKYLEFQLTCRIEVRSK
jgi:hypothetical protein